MIFNENLQNMLDFCYVLVQKPFLWAVKQGDGALQTPAGSPGLYAAKGQ